VEEFKQTIKALKKFVEVSNHHTPYLLEKPSASRNIEPAVAPCQNEPMSRRLMRWSCPLQSDHLPEQSPPGAGRGQRRGGADASLVQDEQRARWENELPDAPAHCKRRKRLCSAPALQLPGGIVLPANGGASHQTRLHEAEDKLRVIRKWTGISTTASSRCLSR